MLEINGLAETSKKISDLADKAKSLEGEHAVSLKDILTDAFISSHTQFPSMDKMLEASGFQVNNQADFDAIPQDKWDEFISSISPFQNWNEMISTAGNEWAQKKLGLSI